MKAFCTVKGLLCVCALFFSALATAALSDVFPADFVALPAGQMAASVYLFESRQEGTWAKGHRLGDAQLSTTVAAARFSRFYRIGEVKVAPVFVLSSLNIALSGNAIPANVARGRSGLGDLRLGGTVWFIDDAQNRHYLGLNLTAMFPSGRYDSHELANPGENRRRQGLMLGWVKGLSDNLTFEAAPEVAWYGSNSANYPGNVRLDQRHTVSLTTYLRYRFAPQWLVFVGAQANEGGETVINGLAQNNPIHGRRFYLGGTYLLDKDNGINLRLAFDATPLTGLKTTQEIALRWISRY